MKTIKSILCAFFIVFITVNSFGQIKIKGTVQDDKSGEKLYAVSVLEKGTTNGVITDFEGGFILEVAKLPITLNFSYIGYDSKNVTVTTYSKPITVKISTGNIILEEAEIRGERVSEKQKQAPLTVESMNVAAIKEAPTGNFYEGLGNLKGVDLTSASLGFKVINTRGFNSTSPVRSLQLIDGVDNQSPGLNFSLGNFLGSSDLDVMKVDIVAGASSAFYGPGAFNGVINMQTKDPFLFPGVSVSFKVGERNLSETAIRIAEVLKNKKGEDRFAYKLNFFTFKAHDWEADNYSPVEGSRVDENNPGRFDAVNIYGDEYFAANNLSTGAVWNNPGLGIFYRTGYKESDLVDYNTENLKGSFALNYRLKPELTYDSPTLIWATSASTGSTVYQGDNRFYLKNIFFIQNRLEFSKKDKFFIRAYMTAEDAGNSYDPYATALKMLKNTRSDENWSKVYLTYWNSIEDRIIATGVPQLEIIDGVPTFDQEAYNAWENIYHDSIVAWHDEVAQLTNNGSNFPGINGVGRLEPGSDEFNEEFSKITNGKSNELENGTRFSDKSKLYHIHGEYIWNTQQIDKITLGSNYRMYRPNSEGTIFTDSISYEFKIDEDGEFVLNDSGEKIVLSETRNPITNQEWGAYLGLEKKMMDNKVILRGALRVDKNQNFNLISTPAVSFVFAPNKQHTFRASLTSALRNPTLADQYLNFDVGPAILKGNLHGVDSLMTVDSFISFVGSSGLNSPQLEFLDIAPIQPEQVKSIEFGYRSSFWEKLFVDMSYYYSNYSSFIGYKIGIKSEFDEILTNLPRNTEVYRYSANSDNDVITQGYSVGYNLYVTKFLEVNGNYSWNNLLKTDKNDPIIPAFNTPEHKINIGANLRKIKFKNNNNHWGLGGNFKWIDGFIFEGSPQFTGFVPTYTILDGQINYSFNDLNLLVKIGASNILDNRHIEVFGGPAIGRLAYFSILYELK